MALVEKNAANDLNNAIRVITKDDYAKGAAALAEAFIDDDVARYFLDTPDRDNWSEARKWKLHSEMMEYITVCRSRVSWPDQGLFSNISSPFQPSPAF